MDVLQIAWSALISLIVVMIVLWLVSLRIKNSSIVDIFWGTGFALISWLYFSMSGDAGYLGRKLLVTLLTTIWGLRLSIHILRRNWGKAEDFRYQTWREAAGKSWLWRSLFQVFLFQGFLIWVISIPILISQVKPLPGQLTWMDILAILLWAIGFFFESVGDAQLARFKRDPANQGRVMDRGLWQFTRHPNYFGDATQWWSFYLFAAVAGGWWSIFSPILMSLLLVKVSGVALLEKTMEGRSGYREYMERTSSFVPWIPKRSKKEI